MSQDADSSGYAGQQSTTDAGSEIDAVTFVVEQVLGRIATIRVVKVMGVSNTGGISPVGTVDVMPMVNQVDGLLGNPVKHGTIYGLPYFRFQGGKNAVILDPEVGDIGICGFADRDSSVVKSTKAQANPGSKRRFDLADGFYFGGFLNGTPENFIAFSDTGINLNGVIIDKNGNIKSPGEITAMSGSIATSVTLSGHKHTQPPDSHGDIEQPTAKPTAGT